MKTVEYTVEVFDGEDWFVCGSRSNELTARNLRLRSIEITGKQSRVIKTTTEKIIIAK